MQDDIKVSIVIPVYNAINYIERAVKSVLSQSYLNFELILVDDGSNDGSYELSRKLALTDDRIKVFHQNNRGVACARNTGIELSTGDCLMFLDCDDWYSPCFLSDMVDAKRRSDMAICGIVKVFQDGNQCEDAEYNCDTGQWCWPIINNYSVSCWRCIFSLELINSKGIRFTDGRKTGEDQEFTYRYMLHSDTVAYAPKAKYYYAINPSSTMFTANFNHFQAVDAMKAVEEYAASICNKERASIIGNALRNFKCPYILEFAILTVITAGEKPKTVLNYLREKGYYDMLNSACSEARHYDSAFMKLWKKSPVGCLRYYYIRRKAGAFVRKIVKK